MLAKNVTIFCIFSIPTRPLWYPPRHRHSVSVQQREQAAGTRHTHGGPLLGTASTECVGPRYAGIPLSEMSTETGHNTY